MTARLRDVAPPVTLVAALLGLWEVWARRAGGASTVLPPPSDVVAAAVRTRDTLANHVLTTLGETALGIVVGVAAGVLIAVVVSLAAPVRAALGPVLVASQTVPVQVLAPLLVLWFGFGLLPKVVVVALVVFFPVTVATAAGIRSADADLADLVRSYGAGRLRTLRLVLLPAALPGLFAGLRISLTYAVAGAVIAESIGARSGLGLYIDRSRRAFRYDQVFAGIAVVVLLSMALYLLTGLFARLFTPWTTLEEDR